jgi:hypothetical protein
MGHHRAKCMPRAIRLVQQPISTVVAGLLLVVVLSVTLNQHRHPQPGLPCMLPHHAPSSNASIDEHASEAYVVLSTGSAPLYAFATPLAALVWRKRQQIEPIIVLVNDVPGSKHWGSNNQTAVILRYLQLWGLKDNIIMLDHDEQLPLNNVAMSQVARAYIAGLCSANGPLANAMTTDAYLITTDVDILPIATRSYWLPDKPGAVGKITNAQCCSRPTLLNVTFQEFPMSTVAFRWSTWRRIMGYYGCICNTSDVDCTRHDFPAHINSDLKHVMRYGIVTSGLHQWGMDQWLMSYNLQRHGKVLKATQLIPRHTGSDRMDRGRNWLDVTSEGALATFIDAHIIRPSHTPENWAKMQSFLHTTLGITSDEHDKALWAQVRQYASEYQAALGDAQRYVLFPDVNKGRLRLQK